MRLYSRQVSLVLGGVFLQVLLHRGFYMVSEAAILNFKTHQIAEWYTFITGPLWSLVIVLPAFVVGYLAARNGLLLGATIGALSSIVYFFTFNYRWASAPLMLDLTMMTGPILLHVVVDAFSAAIVPAFAGSSGEFLRVRRAF
jgi:hypothetical protein